MTPFDKEQEKLKIMVQLKCMENYSRLFGPEHFQKVEMARATLREMLKLDHHVMTVAMTMVGCEGFLDLVDRKDELVELMKAGFQP